MQRFLEFDDCVRLWMTLVVIASNVAPSRGVTRGFRAGEFGVYWSLVRYTEHLVRSKFVLRTWKRRTRAAAHSSHSALWRSSNLKYVITEIIHIIYKAMKHVAVYEIFVTVEVNKSKLIIVILKKNNQRVFAHVLKCAENR